jgi:hypothetical protein
MNSFNELKEVRKVTIAHHSDSTKPCFLSIQKYDLILLFSFIDNEFYVIACTRRIVPNIFNDVIFQGLSFIRKHCSSSTQLIVRWV